MMLGWEMDVLSSISRAIFASLLVGSDWGDLSGWSFGKCECSTIFTATIALFHRPAHAKHHFLFPTKYLAPSLCCFMQSPTYLHDGKLISS